jgi:hypothetical protein
MSVVALVIAPLLVHKDASTAKVEQPKEKIEIVVTKSQPEIQKN